jgi:hypothetical protein
VAERKLPSWASDSGARDPQFALENTTLCSGRTKGIDASVALLAASRGVGDDDDDDYGSQKSPEMPPHLKSSSFSSKERREFCFKDMKNPCIE